MQLQVEVNYEMGEYYFLQEKFTLAAKYFYLSRKYLQEINLSEQSSFVSFHLSMLVLIYYFVCSIVDEKKLVSLLLACNSGRVIHQEDDMVDFTLDHSDSLIHVVENAKWNGDIDSIINLLLKDITDSFLSSQALPFSYRASLPKFFKEPDNNNILCCNAIYAVIHQGNSMMNLM